MTREKTPLLINSAAHENTPSSKKRNIETGVSLLKALPDGMAKVYASFGPLAILYYRGQWLIAPVVIGGVISVSDEAFALLKKRYPENKLVQVMASLAKGTNQSVVGFFEDFGFTMGMLTTVAVQFGGVNYYDNSFAKIVAPLVSIMPAGLIRYMRSRHAAGETNNLPLEIAANTIRSANSPTFILGLLQQQGILAEQSNIPSMGILAGGIIGMFAGIFKKSNPKIAHVLNTLMETIFENPSLAVAFFAFPNDIYAASNNDEITDPFFYSNMAISSCYLVMLIVITVMNAHHEWHELNSTAEVKEDTENKALISVVADEESQLGNPPEEEEKKEESPNSKLFTFFRRFTQSNKSSTVGTSNDHTSDAQQGPIL